MQTVRKVILLMTLVAAGQALDAVAEDRHVTTTAELVELCSMTTVDPAYNAAMGFCLGYIDAALDYHSALTAGPSTRPITCPDATISRREVVAVFLKHAKTNAAQLSNETPIEGVMRAVYDKWPCSEES